MIDDPRGHREAVGGSHFDARLDTKCLRDRIAHHVGDDGAALDPSHAKRHRCRTANRIRRSSPQVRRRVVERRHHGHQRGGILGSHARRFKCGDRALEKRVHVVVVQITMHMPHANRTPQPRSCQQTRSHERIRIVVIVSRQHRRRPPLRRHARRAHHTIAAQHRQRSPQHRRTVRRLRRAWEHAVGHQPRSTVDMYEFAGSQAHRNPIGDRQYNTRHQRPVVHTLFGNQRGAPAGDERQQRTRQHRGAVREHHHPPCLRCTGMYQTAGAHRPGVVGLPLPVGKARTAYAAGPFRTCRRRRAVQLGGQTRFIREPIDLRIERHHRGIIHRPRPAQVEYHSRWRRSE